MKRKPTQHPSWIIPPQGNPGLCSMDKPPTTVTSVSRSESPLDGICLSESEKTAVLTLIREEVTAGDPVFPRCTPIQQPSQGCPLQDPVPVAAVVGSGGSSALPWVGGVWSPAHHRHGAARETTQSVFQGSCVCCNLDHHKGDRSKRVEEKIRRESPRSLRDEVKAFSRVLLPAPLRGAALCCVFPLGRWVKRGRNGMIRLSGIGMGYVRRHVLFVLGLR